jgi:sorbitol-specific phosphotransferase system component IIC
MSDPHDRRHDETTQAPPPRRSGASIGWAVNGIVFGVILLLPGACSLFFIALGMVSGIAIVGLAIGALGIWMILAGVSKLRRR